MWTKKLFGHLRVYLVKITSNSVLTYDPLGEFLVVEETDMRAEEMGETLVEERLDSFCASLSMRR